MLANIFQIRKGNRQRRPGQAATENTAIFDIFSSNCLLSLVRVEMPSGTCWTHQLGVLHITLSVL